MIKVPKGQFHEDRARYNDGQAGEDIDYGRKRAACLTTIETTFYAAPLGTAFDLPWVDCRVNEQCRSWTKKRVIHPRSL
jgi:hypothetical protein